MDLMLLLDTFSRIVHVGTVIALVGGTTFMRFVLMPAAASLPDEEHNALRERLLARWKRFVHIGIALLMASGIYNYLQAIPIHKGDGLYHGLLGTKIILALAVFFIAAALVGRSKVFEGIRAQRARWMTILLLLAAAVVSISGFVKVRGKTISRPIPVQSR